MEPATDRQPKHQNAPARDVTATVNLCGTEPWEGCLLRRVDTIIVPNNTGSAVCFLVEVVLNFMSVITGDFVVDSGIHDWKRYHPGKENSYQTSDEIHRYTSPAYHHI